MSQSASGAESIYLHLMSIDTVSLCGLMFCFVLLLTREGLGCEKYKLVRSDPNHRAVLVDGALNGPRVSPREPCINVGLSESQFGWERGQNVPVVGVPNVGDGCQSRSRKVAEGVEVQQIYYSRNSVSNNL